MRVRLNVFVYKLRSKMIIKFNLLILLSNLYSITSEEVDPNGYILYCSCMGRFGNQAEQLLGSLQFAKSLDRTLILPPFIQYTHYKVEFTPFDNYIDVEALKQYHRVITIENFMKSVAPLVWPEESRTIMCYTSRGADKMGCNPFEGNPFKAFWDHLGVNKFANGSIYHSPLLTDHIYANDWNNRFKDIKVLAFVGAPSAFPTNSEATKLQKYINFSESAVRQGVRYRETRGFARKPYLSVHLRHGYDWVKACDLLKENPDLRQLFSSTQCSPQKAKPLPYDLCFPPMETIIEQMSQIIERSEKSGNKIETIYIATDNNDETLWQTFHQRMPNMTIVAPTVTITTSGETSRSKPPNLITDLYLLSYANEFIGNCISSFSAFVSRFRTNNLNFKQTTQFFGQHLLEDNSYSFKEEL